jgi:hypothetical protein
MTLRVREVETKTRELGERGLEAGREMREARNGQ